MQFKRRKKGPAIVCIVIAMLAAGIGVFFAFTHYRMNQVSELSFDSMLAYTTKHDENAVISVGIMQNGEANYTVYGADAAVLPQAEHVYEIGSITKTFTTSLLFKAISDGKISLDHPIDQYLDVPEKENYPTIRHLITHTSGYQDYYFEPQMVFNFLHGRNDFYGISTEQLRTKVGKVDLTDPVYEFQYSNFGMSVTGAVLSELYQKDYPTLINAYIMDDLGLSNTRISDGSGDLENYWDWAPNDAYLPAGALTSTITDMLKYAQMHMEETPEYLSAAHEALADVHATSAKEAKLSIRIDSVGAGWIIDTENNIIWHNGGTGHYTCYLGFDPDQRIAVVILTNLAPNDRIPATVMGIRLLKELQTEAAANSALPGQHSNDPG